MLSLKNESCKARPTIVNIKSDKSLFIFLLLVLISVVEVVTLLMMYMMEFAFQRK